MFSRIKLLICAIFALYSFVSLSAEIPPDLEKWQGWVKYEQEFRNCPALNGASAGSKANHVCGWPGRLQIRVDDKQASFSQRWVKFEAGRVPLPGGAGYWPQEVKANNQSIVVLENQGQPYIWLEKGEFNISGNFTWEKRPESLRIPDSVALFEVSVNNKRQDFVRVESGQLWLGSESQQQVKEKDFLKLWVNRLIEDDHPIRMMVALQLEVSGRAREQKLTNFSPLQYQLMAVRADLNTRIDSLGDLWVQLKPGSHELRLEFKLHGFPSQIKFEQTGDDWPAQEIWVYQSNERLRATQIDGVSAIDAEQGFVSEWQNLPHFVVNQSDSFLINERHRGMTHTADSLNLSRNMWLSFDGKSYYFSDDITGQKSQDWRVNTLPDYRLTQLSNHGNPRLITYDEKQRTGAEIRTPSIAIQAGGEVDSQQMHHATGWDITFAQTQVQLNVPPGRKVISISGVDYSSGDWVSRWSLIDLFLVLVTTALVFKFFGLFTSCVALITLGLGYHEAHMPTLLWLNLVIAMALALKITGEKLFKYLSVYRWVSVTLLMFALLPFLAEQIRVVLYPQLEMNQRLSAGDRYSSFADSLRYDAAPSEPAVVMQEQRARAMKPKVASEEQDAEMQRITITGSRIKRADLDSGYDAGAVIQAGQGKPRWQWQTVHYGWNGPVTGEESVNIKLLSLGWVNLFRILLIVTSLLWLVRLFQNSFSGMDRLKMLFHKEEDKSKKATNGSEVKGWLIAASLGLLVTANVSQPLKAGEYPNEKLLQELQNRIYPVEKCEPDCISLAGADLQVDGLDLRLTLEYQSGANKAGLLPESADWRIEKIQLNDKNVNNIWRNGKGDWIQLPQGISTVVVTASLKEKSDLAIRFGEKPKGFTSTISGWEISGVTQNQLLSSSIQLTRLVNNNGGSNLKIAAGEPSVQEQSINDLYLLTRSFSFGSSWQLTSKLERRAPLLGSLTAMVPLLPYEQPLDMTDNIQNGQMQVVIPADRQEASWRSSISGEAHFNLTAMDNPAIDEVWEILVYPNWNIQISGVPLVMPEFIDPEDFWIYQYYPRAGETLNFTLNKPPAVEGASVAISNIEQNFTISKRKIENNLSLAYRATRAEQLSLNIGQAEVRQLLHDDKAVSIEPVEGVLMINLKPGEHQLALRIETTQEIEMNLLLPGIEIEQNFSNLSTQVDMPQSRWLIWSSGPGYGPAIVYWGELIFFMLLAVGLSRLPFSPLNYWQWLILGLGMSTFSWPAMGVVSAWLLTGEWRRQNRTIGDDYPRLRNWLIVLSTVAATLALVAAVPYGLLESPDMAVMGNGSDNNYLVWFLDRGTGVLGQLRLISLPIWIYKGLMLIWSTWLSFSLIKWLGWTWSDLRNLKFIRA